MRHRSVTQHPNEPPPLLPAVSLPSPRPQTLLLPPHRLHPLPRQPVGLRVEHRREFWSEKETRRDRECAVHCTSAYEAECADIPSKFGHQMQKTVSDFPNGISDIELNAASAACEENQFGCAWVQIYRNEIFILSFRNGYQTRMESSLLMLQELVQHFSDIPDVIMMLWWHDIPMVKDPNPVFPLFAHNTLSSDH